MNSLRNLINIQLRPSIWALRTRRDISPLHASLRDYLHLLYVPGSNQEHIQSTLDWLCAAQDSTGDGVAAFYDVRMGEWSPPYPETTGYIIPTFLNVGRFYGKSAYVDRATRMAGWLLTLQLPSGAFPIGPLWPDWPRDPIVFDTGQIIHGLVRAYEETADPRFIEAVIRAGDWLLEIQEEDGSWRKYTSLGYVHTYNVRTAWSLLRIFDVCKEERYRNAAIRNLDWSLKQQDGDGWYRGAAFRPGENPLTHTIAYTIEGFLESGIALSKSEYITSAQRAADAVLDHQIRDGYIRARFGPKWASAETWCCLTGTAQMALVWLRLYEVTGDKKYFHNGILANKYIKQRQVRTSRFDGVQGGLAGSYPIYEEYEPYRNLNWAAKFFVDSLLLEEQVSLSTQ